MKIEENLNTFNEAKESIDKWEASENIIDKSTTVWQIKNPDDRDQYVCLLRNRKDMYIGGCYGIMTFGKMTQMGSVHDFDYDNPEKQMEYMSVYSQNNQYEINPIKFRADIKSWLSDYLDAHYLNNDAYDMNSDVVAERIVAFCENGGRTPEEIQDCIKVDNLRFMDSSKKGAIGALFDFVLDCFSHTNHEEWEALLEGSRLSIYTDSLAFDLKNAGKSIKQSYLLCVYALDACSKKLNQY